MVARTRGWLKPVRDKPDKELPSLPPDRVEVKQSVAEQLRHAQEQIALTRQYPGRTPPRE